MTLTSFEAVNAAPPAWWGQSTGRGGEADSAETDVGGVVKEGFGFGDLLDVINPLHHIPIVGMIYRQLTGDAIAEAPHMVGGALWGGPMGVIAALTDSVVRGETGHDTGTAVLAWLDDTPVETGGDLGATLATLEPIEQTPDGVALTALTDGPKPDNQPPVDISLIGQAGADQMTASQGVFQGRTADRLDAFIRKANAIRPASSAPTTSMPTTPIPATLRADASDTLSAPAGGTDVSRWMLNALDRYQTMRRAETG
ncbi:MAG: hypothetical protein HQ481_03305 [Alphaproteobacteria bacterium]|nr:hypothetical protein [Alphaproteobacteria bacterium]